MCSRFAASEESEQSRGRQPRRCQPRTRRSGAATRSIAIVLEAWVEDLVSLQVFGSFIIPAIVYCGYLVELIWFGLKGDLGYVVTGMRSELFNLVL